MKRHMLLVTALLLVGMAVAPTVVLAAEDPRFETQVPEPTVTPGETTQIAVEFTNDAKDIDDRVETATNVKATMKQGGTPFTVLSGTHRLGRMPDGQVITDRFSIRVPQNVEPGTYRVPIEIEYVFDGDEEETTTVYAKIVVEDRAMFSIVDLHENLTVGESGTVTMTLENTGTETVTDATVTLQSETENVAFGSNSKTVAFVGEWDAGENRTITVDATSPASAEAGTYSIAATVAFENSDGFERQWPPLSAGVSVDPETDQFTLGNVQHSLRVGQEGELTMTVTNEGAAVTDAVLRLTGAGTNIHPLASEYALGDLQAGESVPVTFPIEISESAEATPQQFGFAVTYENTEGDERTTEPLKITADLAPDRDRFVVTPVNVSIAAGSGDQIAVRVRNNGNSTVKNVDAKIFTNDPLSSADDEAYIESLAPGESAKITFGVAAAGSANVKTYPLSLDFQYDSGGDSKLSKTYRVPLSVTEPVDTGPSPSLIGGAVVVVALLIAVVLYRRR
ncbi:MAG: COG1361 S-layer family protein [Halodesulfurarchaeum sp.]